MSRIAGGAIIENNKILLVKRSASKELFPNKWGFPAGKMEEGETPEEAVIREVKEEVGLDFTPTKLIHQSEFDNYNFYKFVGDFSGDVVLQEEEHDEFGWFTYEEAKKLDLSFHYCDIVESLYDKNLLRD